MNSRLVERFLRYTKYDTQSDVSSKTFPSTAKQIDFAKVLVEECKELGLEDVILDEHGYVMATLPSNTDKDIPTIGFIAHMDTAPDYPGKDVKAFFTENYDGGDIIMNKELGYVLSPKQFPFLKDFVGETLITTDGTTLLGADDKAGIASILNAVEYFNEHPEIKHGKIRIGFTPDEEVGRGVDYFDVEKFGAKFAYTIDGGRLGEVQTENFNAASATVTIHGVSVHPGDSKGKMKNSINIGCKFQSMLPGNEVPEHTEGFEGFYHLHTMNTSIELTTMQYILRDHDKDKFASKKKMLEDVCAALNDEYGEGTVEVSFVDSYFNMKEVLDEYPEIAEIANTALKNLGVAPINEPIRGGTDGARLSFMGLPCPNIFTGAYNFHGKYEFAVVSHMEKSSASIVEIAKLVAE